MKIGITGASGFLGSTLRRQALTSGHEVVGFSRSPDPNQRLFSLDHPLNCEGLDVVIHLAGEPIMGLWTKTKRERILNSRVEGTRRVVEGIAKNPPKVLISASAIGFYGDTGENLVQETSPAGRGFLAEVAGAWEAEAKKATGSRVVLLRVGFVLGRGGALKWITPVFRCGVGGKLGNGRQWMSVIHAEDVAGMALWAAENDGIEGPLNAVLPMPSRNEEFTRQLAHSLHRPALLPVPAVVLRTVLGDLSHLMLDSLRVEPRVALDSGYSFRHPTLSEAIAEATR